MNNSVNDVRVTARIPLAVKKTLQQAADLSGATLNQFLIQAALKEANNILEAEGRIFLSSQDADQIFNLLENPYKPNEQLKKAFSKHQEFFHETDRSS